MVGFRYVGLASISMLIAAPIGLATVLGRPQASRSSASIPKVKVLNGTYTGLHSPEYNEDFFLGIPYAQPPVNNLRFTVPQSLNSTFSGPRAAIAYSPGCVGYGDDDVGYVSSEDCLTLNVIRPAIYTPELLPVAVWFYGGGNFEGGSADKRYNLSFIVQNSVTIGKPIIGVSVNYRVSAWGFLYSNEVAGTGNTNLGLRDQRLALHWLQENIEAFGGDPGKVTIWGESAGAMDVGLQLTAYGGRDDRLFRAAIMQSGNPIGALPMRGTNFYQPIYDLVVQQTGCSDKIDTLQCLRTVPFEQLNAVLNDTTFSTSWGFVIDGDFIERYGSIQLAEGAFVHVPIIDGANTDEGTAFSPRGIDSTAEFLCLLERGIGLPSVLAQSIIAAYPSPTGIGQDGIPAQVSSVPASFGLEYRRTAAFFGDSYIIASRRLTCETWATHSIPAYCYRFNAIPAQVPYYHGVTHFSEIAFVFLNLEGYGYDAVNGFPGSPFAGKPQSYVDLARLMASSWASFVHDLDPNSFRAANRDVAGKTERWLVYSVDGPMDYVFDANVSSYAEPDTFRAKGIALINSAAVAFHR